MTYFDQENMVDVKLCGFMSLSLTGPCSFHLQLLGTLTPACCEEAQTSLLKDYRPLGGKPRSLANIQRMKASWAFQA